MGIVGLSRTALLGAALAMMCGAAHALTVEEIATLKGPNRQQILLDGAKAEGKVVLYSAMIVDQALRPLVTAFKAKYPQVDLEFWREDSTSSRARSVRACTSRVSRSTSASRRFN